MADGASGLRQERGLRRHAPGFVIGLAAGAVLMAAGSAVTVTDEDMDKLREALIYAISALAVDTERNAKGIVSLEERVDDLEARLAEIVNRAK